MNDEGECDRNSDEHKRPWATELGGHGSRCREEHEHLEDTAPLGCPLLKVAEHDIADREDRCHQGDFKPGIHVRRRGECRGLTRERSCKIFVRLGPMEPIGRRLRAPSRRQSMRLDQSRTARRPKFAMQRRRLRRVAQRRDRPDEREQRRRPARTAATWR